MFCRPLTYKPCQLETNEKMRGNIMNFMGFLHLHRKVLQSVSPGIVAAAIVHFERSG